jgi:hypothetical protein
MLEEPLSSTVEQQDDADGDKDGVIPGDTSITPYPSPVETRRTMAARTGSSPVTPASRRIHHLWKLKGKMAQPATKAFPANYSQKLITLLFFQ